MRSFFAEVYGHDLTESEIDAILRTDMNGGNPGYARFMAAAPSQ
jgi:hypothetical protein